MYSLIHREIIMRLSHIKDEVVFDGKYTQMILRHVLSKSGKPIVWEMVRRKTHGRIVAIVPVTIKKEVVLVKIYRVPVQSYVIEACAGLMDVRGESEEDAARREMLEDAIEETVKAGGVLMIPAFAMERTQELLSELDALVTEGRIPSVPVFMDSPLAIKLTAVYKKYADYLKAGNGFDFSFKNLRLTETTEQSKAINEVPPPKVIIAGSGMSHGGRILHHERHYLPDPKSTLLIIGYQSVGSLGRRLLDGAGSVKIFGEEVPVRCRVKNIGGYSAHADQAQLLAWLYPRRTTLKKVFLVQGEEGAGAALGQKIRDELAVEALMPEMGKPYELI